MSASVGTRISAGFSPSYEPRTAPAGVRHWRSTTPCCTGQVPVPIVAWMAGVTDGDDPTTAFSTDVPPRMMRLRLGHALGHWLRTFQPPPSHATTRIAFGGAGRSPSGTSASEIDAPERSAGPLDGGR